MSEPIAREDRSAESGGLFAPDEPVHDLLPEGPRFGDEIWDFAGFARTSQGDRYLRITDVTGHYEQTARHLLLVLGRPMHPAVVEKGIVSRRRPAPLGTLLGHFSHMKTMATWGVARGLPGFYAWEQADADEFLQSLRMGQHRLGGSALAPSTVRGYVTTIKLLHEYSPVLPRTIQFTPWFFRSAVRVAGEVTQIENITEPLPWDVWRPLVAASSAFINNFSADILAADRALRDAPTGNRLNRGATGPTALLQLQDYFADGGHVPLHTGFGKSGSQPRGGTNLAVLQRLAGISGICFKRTHRAYLPELYGVIDEALARGQGSQGGLILPTVRIEGAGGKNRPWISEIGMGEAEYLPSLLRGAAYVLIASLTGMRDSEIQELTTDCLGEEDGLTVLRGRQFKGRDEGGEGRYWWAPTILERTVSVLAELSHHPSLFARVPRSGEVRPAGTYDPQRDIGRLVDFVNGDPESRVGRGAGLALEKIAASPGQPINATSLRRSYSVFASTYPGAVIGLGMQLGHAALRETSAYGRDGQERTVKMLNDDRIKVVKAEVARIVRSGSVLAAAGGEELSLVRAQVFADPTRAERLMDQVADRYHLGITNDCFYRESGAACGTDGPHLASHFCASSNCARAVVHEKHVPVILAQIERLDRQLERPKGHQGIIASLRVQRADLAGLLSQVQLEGVSDERNPETS